MKKSLFRTFSEYVTLSVLGMLALSCYILADTFFVSKGLGSNGLAALNLAIPVYSFVHGAGLMLGMGGATKFAISAGRGDGQKSNRIFTNTVIAGAVFAAAFLLCGIFLSEKLTALLGADEAVFEMTNTYLKVILLFAPAFLCNNILLCFVRNDGKPRLSMAAMLVGSLSNVVLDYVFIFPLGMGIFGAVFATGLAPIISISVLSVHFIKKRNRFRLERTKPDPRLIGASMSLGFPSLITEVSAGIVMIVFNSIMLKLQGNVGVAAYGIIANLSLVVASIHTGIAQGIQPLVAGACGREDRAEIRKIVKYAFIAMLSVSVLVYLAMFFLGNPIAGIFNGEGNALLQEIAVSGMKLYFLSVPFVGFNVIVSMYFTSTNRPLPSHTVSLLRGFVFIIPAAFLLSALLQATGVWLAFPISEFLAAAVGAIMFWITAKREKRRQIPKLLS